MWLPLTLDLIGLSARWTDTLSPLHVQSNGERVSAELAASQFEPRVRGRNFAPSVRAIAAQVQNIASNRADSGV
jgi:hypothetical protein